MIFDKWIALYGTLTFLLTDNGLQLAPELPEYLNLYLEFRKLTKTGKAWQTIGEV